MTILPPSDLHNLRSSDLTTNIQDQMDASKAATGLNANSSASTDTDLSRQSGEEPLSGEKGRGTAEEPFDAGNAEGELGFTFFFHFFIFVLGWSMWDRVCWIVADWTALCL